MSLHSKMPYICSDEEVWEEKEVSGDDDSDCGPGFLDPTRQAPAFTWCLHSSLSEIMKFLHVLIKNYNITGTDFFMLSASVFKPKQYDLKDFTSEIYRNEWIGENDLWTLFYVSGLVH